MSDIPKSDEITFFAKTNFRNREVPFGIKTDDRRRHMYLIGKTGMGKTTMMENMVIQDIRQGKGVCFIDPHGDSVAKILDFVPNERINDVIYFNPADLEYPVAFNILEAVDTKYKHLVASGLMGVFTKIWANLWSARMEYILNNTILALLDSPGNTMLGIARMYIDKRYRKKIIDNIKDPMVRAFWVDEFANYNDKYRTEAIAPIQNKVGQFLSSSIIRNIVGQPRSTLDLRSIMDNQKILLVDLSKGKVGEDNSALLGAMIITKLQLAALSRVDIQEDQRKDFYLYVDEFQNFVTDSFATILSEARKYRLNLTIGHQYIGQLLPDPRNFKVRDAVFGNVGSMVVFRIGAADAEFLEKEFTPAFELEDLLNLPKAHIILKLMINGVASEPFSAITLPPISEDYTANGEKVIKVSRERYANPMYEVEEKISRWMGAEYHEQSAILINQGEENLPAKTSDDIQLEQSFTSELKITEQQGEEIISNEAVQKPITEPETLYVTSPSLQAMPVETKPRFSPLPEKQAHSLPKSGSKKFPTFSRSSPPGTPARQTFSTAPAWNRKKSRSKFRPGDQRNQNPVWKTVERLNIDKVSSPEVSIANALNKILSKPLAGADGESPKPSTKPLLSALEDKSASVPIAPSENQSSTPSKTMVQPGEVHKF